LRDRAVADEEPNVRRTALLGLRRSSSKATLAVIRERATDDHDPQVRIYALRLLVVHPELMPWFPFDLPDWIGLEDPEASARAAGSGPVMEPTPEYFHFYGPVIQPASPELLEFLRQRADEDESPVVRRGAAALATWAERGWSDWGARSRRAGDDPDVSE
jgi:HEAT repeat protein